MRYIIYITIALVSAFCFNNAMAQGVSMFGALRAQDTSKTRGQLVIPTLTNSDTNKVLTADAAGRFYYVTKSNGTPIDTTLFVRYTDTSRSGIVTTYFYVDSLYNSIGTHDSLVKYSDSLTGVYATGYGVDTAKSNLRTSIATKLSYTDTTSLIPTKTFLLNNYYIKGGNTFGANQTIGLNDAFALDFETSGLTRMRLFANGRIGINTATDAGYQFDVTGTGHYSDRLNVGSLTLGTKSPLLTVSGASVSNNTSNVATYGAIAVVADIAPSGGEGGGVYFGSRQGLQALIRSSLTSGAGSTTGDLIFSTRNATGDASFTDRLRINNTGQIWQGNPVTAVRLASNFTTEASANFGATGIYTISDFANIGSNYYYISPNFLAKTGVMSAQIDWTSGNHDFKIAPIVTANSAITWTTAMRINNSTGFVGLNRLTPSHRLTVGGQVKIDTIAHRSVITDSILVRNGGVISSRLPENYYTGWAQYIDTTYTSTSPFIVSSSTTDTLENNAQTIINSQKPVDAVGEMYVAATKDIRAIDTFDSYLISIRFKGVSDFNFDNFKISLDIGGALGVIGSETRTFTKNAGNEQEFNVNFIVFSGATFIANGGTILITTNGGNISFYDINYLITRTHKAR